MKSKPLEQIKLTAEEMREIYEIGGLRRGLKILAGEGAFNDDFIAWILEEYITKDKDWK